jgi:RHS repeat-associated protein
VHEDTDTDSDVDGNDKWYYDAYDEAWRQSARFRESDTAPKEEFIAQCAGVNGLASASVVDLVVCRDRDANTAWTTASDGTLEERAYYCQNQHADVSTIIASTGAIREWATYSAYGVPLGMPGGDANSDGDCDTGDVAQIQTWISTPIYDVRGDLDLDGDVDTSDKSIASGSPFAGVTAGYSVISSVAGNSRAYTGIELLKNLAILGGRYRSYLTKAGRWLSRDSIEYADGPSLYQYVLGRPVRHYDPMGLSSTDCRPVAGQYPGTGSQSNGPSQLDYAGVSVDTTYGSLIPGDCRSGASCRFTVNVAFVDVNPIPGSGGHNGESQAPGSPYYNIWHGTTPNQWPRWGAVSNPPGDISKSQLPPQGASIGRSSQSFNLQCNTCSAFQVSAWSVGYVYYVARTFYACCLDCEDNHGGNAPPMPGSGGPALPPPPGVPTPPWGGTNGVPTRPWGPTGIPTGGGGGPGGPGTPGVPFGVPTGTFRFGQYL